MFWLVLWKGDWRGSDFHLFTSKNILLLSFIVRLFPGEADMLMNFLRHVWSWVQAKLFSNRDFSFSFSGTFGLLVLFQTKFQSSKSPFQRMQGRLRPNFAKLGLYQNPSLQFLNFLVSFIGQLLTTLPMISFFDLLFSFSMSFFSLFSM